MRRAVVLVVSVLTIGGLAACGNGVAPGAGATAGPDRDVTDGGAERTKPDLATSAEARALTEAGAVRGVGFVLANQDHGPQLCLGGIGYSNPPQCTGVELIGWDWAQVDGEQSGGGATYGDYTVTGTWDGERLTVISVGLAEYETEDPGLADPSLLTPCEPPAGGWAVVDEATATDASREQALLRASREPDFAGAWADQSVDPANPILNVMFTGDLERHEAELRARWGGALCVSGAPRSQAELHDIQSELIKEPNVLGTSPDDRAGTIEVSVIIDDAELQARLDARYGPGVIVLTPALVPVE